MTTKTKKTKPHGRHPEKRLTAVTVRSLKAPGRYADGNGLYLFVRSRQGRSGGSGVGSSPASDPISDSAASQLVPLADARDEAARLSAHGARRRQSARRTAPRSSGSCRRSKPPRLAGPRRAQRDLQERQAHARSGSRRSRADVFPRHRRSRRSNTIDVGRRADRALPDLDGETGNRAPAEAAHEARVRLGEGVRASAAATTDLGVTTALPKHGCEQSCTMPRCRTRSVSRYLQALRTSWRRRSPCVWLSNSLDPVCRAHVRGLERDSGPRSIWIKSRSGAFQRR